jgi:hypothetical protein
MLLVTVLVKLILVACQIIFNGTKGNFKKSCYLLFQQYNLAIEFDSFYADVFLDFSNGIRVVEDVLPVDIGTR